VMKTQSNQGAVKVYTCKPTIVNDAGLSKQSKRSKIELE
jgi:hypothetical protein